jgi:hypothetical protein
MSTTYDIFVDDGGSKAAGYVVFAGIFADRLTSDKMKNQVEQIKKKYSINYLHAKDFMTNQVLYEKIYIDLFNSLISIIKSGARRHVWIRFGTVLENSKNEITLREFIEKIVQQIYLSQDECRKLAKPISYMLLPILEISENTLITQQNNTKVFYTIDQTNEYLEYIKNDYEIDTPVAGKSIVNGSIISCKAINAYLKAYNKNNLQFEETILADSKNHVEIELMDAISNFSWNWLKCEVAETYVPKVIEQCKHDIFENFLIGVSEAPFEKVTTRNNQRNGFKYDGTHLIAKTNENIGMLRIC